MKIQILPKIGGQPIEIEAAQLLVINDANQPVLIAGEYGLKGAICISHAGEDTFNQTLKAFGHGQVEVICQHVKAAEVRSGAVPR